MCLVYHQFYYKYLMLTVILLARHTLTIQQQPLPPLVQVKQGVLEGKYDGVSRGGRSFYQFKGIQYAVIEERFKPSVKPPVWNATKPAKDFGPACNDVATHGDENCLFLNVYTPMIGKLDYPVVVYIHGGSFQFGDSNRFGPNYLMDEDVVFVTINYRLGILGFLSTEDENSPGNYGLKDQTMALRWVQENIAAFGGDPDKVTIMGQSAGSASVTYHLLSPMSKGLFRFAIAQSGTFLDPWAYTRKPLRYTRKFSALIGCENGQNTTAIVKCLRDTPATIIANRQLAHNATVKFFEDPFAAFGPTIEPVVGDGSSTFLAESPYELLVNGSMSKVPLLTGIVQEEGIYIWAAYLLYSEASAAVADRQKLQTNWSQYSPAAFYFDEFAPSERLEEIAGQVKEFYFKSGFSLDDNATFTQLSHLYSDRLFVASSVNFINLYSKHSPTYPYLYTFNRYVGIEFGWEELHRNYSLDATHAAELDMLISPLFYQVRSEPDHDALSKSVVKLWNSFIQYGVPNATFGSERNFPPVNASQGLQKWYQLDQDTRLSENIFSERVAFWQSLNLTDYDFYSCYC